MASPLTPRIIIYQIGLQGCGIAHHSKLIVEWQIWGEELSDSHARITSRGGLNLRILLDGGSPSGLGDPFWISIARDGRCRMSDSHDFREHEPGGLAPVRLEYVAGVATRDRTHDLAELVLVTKCHRSTLRLFVTQLKSES
jgi:hypothetical protein